MSAPVLAVEDLRVEVSRGGLDIVDDVAFEVAHGEVLGLVGESGSGKTTVGLAVLGHTRRGARIAHGRVVVDGDDVLGSSARELRALRGRSVSYVPQDPGSALNPAMRVGPQLEELLEAHDFGGTSTARRERLLQMLDEVLLPTDASFLKRYPHQLSGGQQQRVGLAMAFACRPSVIVLDEPTTGLDVTTQAHVLGTVRHLCEAHRVAAVYISHDLAVVATVASRIAVMYGGRIIEGGPRQTLFRSPAHPYTQRLIEAIPEVSGRHALEGIAGSAPRPGHRPAGCSFAPRCGYVVEECRVEFPPAEQVSDGHGVRCFRRAAVLAHSARARPAAIPPLAADSSHELLAVRQVDARYGDQAVVFGVELAIGPRQCVALVGESGSGKTTLTRCIAGLHRDYSGEILLRAEPLAHSARKRSREAKREIQYVFQNPYSSLNPRKTVFQTIARRLRLFSEVDGKECRRRVVEVLERVGISPTVIDSHPHQLSGGERQRVAIARALVAEPTLLLCDEITSALDVSAQASIVNLIAELQREMQLGLLFVTHNLPLIRTIADEVVVMHQGRIVERGKVGDVFDSPRESYTLSLLADTPSIEAAQAPAGAVRRATPA